MHQSLLPAGCSDRFHSRVRGPRHSLLTVVVAEEETAVVVAAAETPAVVVGAVGPVSAP